MNTDDAGLQKMFAQDEDLATAALKTAGNTDQIREILADILAQARGEQLPFTSPYAGNPLTLVAPNIGVQPIINSVIASSTPVTTTDPATVQAIQSLSGRIDALAQRFDSAADRIVYSVNDNTSKTAPTLNRVAPQRFVPAMTR